MGLFASLTKPKKLPAESMQSFLGVQDYPANCEIVVNHMREAIRKHTGTQWPLYLFFDIKSVGEIPEPTPWARWDPTSVPEEQLPAYPRIVQFAWIFCDERQHVYMARKHLIKPENFELPDDCETKLGFSKVMAKERGARISDALKEFCNGLAPATRIVTFNGSEEGVTLEVEMRRNRLPFHFNRNFFYDLRERSKKFCALQIPCDDEDQVLYRPPELRELYEKLFGGLDGEWDDAAAQVQVLEKCYFKLIKKEVL